MTEPSDRPTLLSLGNPYEPPRQTSSARERSAVREIVLSWEKLRIVYNVGMLLFGCASTYSTFGRLPFPATAAVVGVGANLAYFLGPLAELYVYALVGRPSRVLRYLLFGAGVLFSIVMLNMILMAMLLA